MSASSGTPSFQRPPSQNGPLDSRRTRKKPAGNHSDASKRQGGESGPQNPAANRLRRSNNPKQWERTKKHPSKPRDIQKTPRPAETPAGDVDDEHMPEAKHMARQSAEPTQLYTNEEKQATGPVFEDPLSLGFMSRNRGPCRRVLPRFMVDQPRLLTAPQFERHPWDEENQEKMLDMERANNGSDFQGIYEQYQKMREVERKKMEDLGLVDAENIRKDLSDAIFFQGTCLDMCPAFERVRRSLENNVKNLEKDPATNRISRERAVKAFSRPAAGQPPPMPSDVRPPHILSLTLDYIINEVLNQLPEAHSFIWDRTRSIRQDFIYQNYYGPEAIDCNEKIVRIHLLSLHVMACSDVEYSQQQELEQFNKASQTLIEIYQDVRNHGGSCPNEAEFRAYHLLSHYRDPELEREIQNLPESIFQDPKIQLALRFRTLMSQNNVVERGFTNVVGAFNQFVEFFRLVNETNTPILMACMLETHFNEFRFYALKSLSRSYHSRSKGLPAVLLQEMMGFNTVDELISFVEYYDVDIIHEDELVLVDLCNKEKLESVYKLNSANDKPKLSQAYSTRLTDRIKSASFKKLVEQGQSNANLGLSTAEKDIVRPTSLRFPKVSSKRETDLNLTLPVNGLISHSASTTQKSGDRSWKSFDQSLLPKFSFAPSTSSPNFGQPPTGLSTFGQKDPGLNNTTLLDPKATLASRASDQAELAIPPNKGASGSAFGGSKSNFDFHTDQLNKFFVTKQKENEVQSNLSRPQFALNSNDSIFGGENFIEQKKKRENKEQKEEEEEEEEKIKQRSKTTNDDKDYGRPKTQGFSFGNKADIAPSIQTKTASLIPSLTAFKVEQKNSGSASMMKCGSKHFAAATESIYSDILHHSVQLMLTKVLSRMVKTENKARERARVINMLAEELFSAFVSEASFKLTMLSVATAFNDRKTKLRAIALLKRKALLCLDKQKIKKGKIEELLLISFQVPNLKRQVSSRASLCSSPRDKRRKVLEDHFRNIQARQQEIQDLWKPLNLQEFVSECSMGVKLPRLHNSAVHLAVLLIVENWNAPLSKWLNTKFSLKVTEDKTYYSNQIISDRVAVEFRSLPAAKHLNEKLLQSTPFIIFECGIQESKQHGEFGTLEKKLLRDRGILEKIVAIATKLSLYKIQVLVVSWDTTGSTLSEDQQRQLLGLSELKSTFPDLQDVLYCSMSAPGANVASLLEDGLIFIASKFTGALTSRGLRKRERALVLERKKQLTEQMGADRDETAVAALESNLKAKEEKILSRVREADRRKYLSLHATGNRSMDLTNTTRTPNGSFANHTLMNYSNTLGNNTMLRARDMSFLKSFATGSILEESTPQSTLKSEATGPEKLRELRELTASIMGKYKR